MHEECGQHSTIHQTHFEGYLSTASSITREIEQEKTDVRLRTPLAINMQSRHIGVQQVISKQDCGLEQTRTNNYPRAERLT